MFVNHELNVYLHDRIAGIFIIFILWFAHCLLLKFIGCNELFKKSINFSLLTIAFSISNIMMSNIL